MKPFSIVEAGIIFLCCSMNNDRVKILKFAPFNPDYKLTLDQLLEDGFKTLNADVLMVQKFLNDSTQVKFLIDSPSQSVLIEQWSIKFNEFNTDTLTNFVEKNYSGIVTPLCLEQDVYTFFVKNYISGLYFRCYFVHAYVADKVYLNIMHEYPLYYQQMLDDKE
jgi:hypothetical protein